MIRWMFAAVVMVASLGAAESANRKFQLGEFEVIAIQDTPGTMRAELFRGAPETEIRKLMGPSGEAPSSVNVFLLKRDGEIILVDTGNGGDRGMMLNKLKQEGIEPGQINSVLLTHMHGDHIGGLLDKNGKTVFNNAHLYVSIPERDYWQGDSSGQRGELARNVLKTYGEKVKAFRFGDEVLPGIKALDAIGHTPGHTVFETDSLLIIGDLLHAAAIQIPRPDIFPTYDMDPAKAVQTRRQYYDLAAGSSKVVAGMHLPFPGVGRLGKNASGYTYTPAN